MPVVYDAGSNTITVTGYTVSSPCTFTDVYNADVAGGWGVVSRQGLNQFLFSAFLQVGDGGTQTYFAGLNSQVVFADGLKTANNQILIRVMRYAVFRLGALDDAARKRTSSGCAVWDAGQTYYCSLVRPASDAADCEIYLYGSQFRGLFQEAWVEGRHMYNLLCDGRSYPHLTTYTSADMNNVIVSGGSYGIRMPKQNIAINNLFLMTTSQGIWVRTYQSATLKNVYARQNTRLVYVEKMLTDEVDSYLINVDSDNWVILWSAATSSKLWRQYEFDLTTEPNAVVELLDSNGDTALYQLNGSTWEPVGSVTADENGVIPTKNFRLQYYCQPSGSVPTCSGPFYLRIRKAGYQTYFKPLEVPVDPATGYYNPQKPFKLQIKLAQAVPVLNGMGHPILNLKPTDPENAVVLPL